MTKEQADLTKKKLNLTITTPRGVKFVEEADTVTMRCIDGDLGILPGHQATSTILGDGILKIINNGVEKLLALFGGVVNIDDTNIEVYSTIAQLPEEIDLERAKRDREEAEAAMKEVVSDTKLKRAQAMMRRSLVRIEVNLHLEDTEYFDVEDEDDEDKNNK